MADVGAAPGGPISGAVGPMLQGAAPGAGAEAMQAQLQQVVQQIRQIGDLVAQVESSNPMLAGEAQQIAQLLKQMVIKSAQQAPQQTMSGAMTPGGGA